MNVDSHPHNQPPDRPRGRPDAAKTGGARELVRRTRWLNRPLLYWSGAPPETVSFDELPFRSVEELAASELAGEPPGLFTLGLDYREAPRATTSGTDGAGPFLNPKLRLTRIEEARLNDAAQALVATRRYPKALPKVLEDAEEWRRRTERRLERLRRLHERAGGGESFGVEQVGLEAEYMWVGPEGDRPSRSVSTADIEDCLQRAQGSELPPDARAAALALGQRRAPGTDPDRGSELHRIGSAFSRWPLHVLQELTAKPRIRRHLLTLVRDGTAERLNSPLLSRGLSEHRLHSEPASSPPLGGLLRLLDSLERVREEPARRIGIYASSFRSAGVDPYAMEASRLYALLSSGSAAVRDEWQRLFGFPEEDFDEFVAKGWASTHVNPNAPEEQEPERLVPHLHAIVPDGHCPSLEASCLGLAGRLGAWTADPAGFVTDVADWIDVGRELVPPGGRGCDGLLAGVEALMVAGAHAGRDGERIENTARVLARSGGEILQMIGARSTRDWPLRYWLSRDDDLPIAGALAKSSVIDPEDARILARHRFLWSYAKALSSRPGAADLALRCLRELARRAEPIRTPPALLHLRRLGWQAAELAAWPDRALAEQSCGWLLHQVEHREPAELEWLTALTDGLTRFLGEAEGHPPAGEEPADHGRYLREHWSLWERLVEASRASKPRTPDEYVLSDAAYVYLCVLYWEWDRGGHPDPIAEALPRDGDWRERLAAWERHAWEPLRFAVRVAGGEVEGLRSLMAHDGHRFWQGLEAGRPLSADRLWSVLEDDDELLRAVRDAAAVPELSSELLDALQRVALAVRLSPGPDPTRWLEPWPSPPRPELDLPTGIEGDQRERLETVAAFRRLAGENEPLSNLLTDVLHRRENLEEELAWLERRQSENRLPDGALPRLRKLRELLPDSRELAEWIGADLRTELPRALTGARLRALDAQAGRRIEDFCRDRFGTVPDTVAETAWENALSLYLSLQQKRGPNRHLLRQLLEARLAGDDDWPASHPGNQRFLQELRETGADVDAWLGEHELTVELGEGRWRAYAAADPLQVLRMGELFDTCLAPGDVNDHTTVAHAVEVNRRVLYLEDGRGVVIGRRLIAVFPDGELVGFRSYGHGNRQLAHPAWVKILFDQLCLRIARKAGLELLAEEVRGRPLEGELSLFAKSHYDRPEPFDGWVLALADGASPERLLDLLHAEDGVEGARLLLWLERFHPDFVTTALDAWDPGEEALEYLGGQSTTTLLRQRLAAK